MRSTGVVVPFMALERARRVLRPTCLMDKRREVMEKQDVVNRETCYRVRLHLTFSDAIPFLAGLYLKKLSTTKNTTHQQL